MPEHRRRGYISQALDLLSAWVLIEQGLARVEVRVAVENLPSQSAAEKAGFVREGIARQAGRVHSGRVDLVIFSRVSSDLANARRGVSTISMISGAELFRGWRR